MTELSTDQLKKSFHQEMINLYKMIIKLVKYKPTRLMDYINKYGGYEAAVKYISTESNVQDFAVLWEKERLDLSVEALITSETYRVLFPEEMVAFCDRKLKEYSYAPNKIEEVEEPSGYFDEDEKIDLAELLKQKELYLPKVKQKDYPMYNQAIDISVEQWKTLLQNTKVVTANNLDLLLRIYSIGDAVGPKELAKEEGYSNTYPFKEVTMALGKRIKMQLKIDVPVGKDGKPIWWHMLFNGGLKDNTEFEWSLKKSLRQAIDELIAAGTIEKVATQTQKELQEIKEEQIVNERPVEVHSNTKDHKQDTMSAFDRLFESIMSPTSVPKEEKPSVTEMPTPNKEEVKVAIQETMEDKEVVTAKEETIVEEKTPDIEAEVKSTANLADYKTAIKKECLEYYGAICDICGFDFGYTYGESFEMCIDVHNIHGVEGEEILLTTHPVDDLIPVCHNCHHVIHSTVPPIPVEKMRKMVKA